MVVSTWTHVVRRGLHIQMERTSDMVPSTARLFATACLAAVCVASCSGSGSVAEPGARAGNEASGGDEAVLTGSQLATSDEAAVTEQAAAESVESIADSEEETARPPSVVEDVAPSMDPGAVAADDSELDALITPALRAAAEALENPAVIDEDVLYTVAQGVALDEMKAMAAEFEVNGWTQSGAPVVIATELTDLDQGASPPEAVVSACLDHSGVEIVDDSGKSMVDPGARTRVLNILELEYVEERWVLVGRSFPDDPSC